MTPATSITEHFKKNQDMRADTASIHVTVHEGLAVLEGEIGSLEKKQLAEEITLRVSGIEAVINKLKVVRSESSAYGG